MSCKANTTAVIDRSKDTLGLSVSDLFETYKDAYERIKESVPDFPEKDRLDFARDTLVEMISNAIQCLRETTLTPRHCASLGNLVADTLITAGFDPRLEGLVLNQQLIYDMGQKITEIFSAEIATYSRGAIETAKKAIGEIFPRPAGD